MFDIFDFFHFQCRFQIALASDKPYILGPAKANSPTLIIPTTSSTIALEWEAVNEGPIARTYYVSWRAAGSVSSKTRTVSRTSHIIGHLQSNSAYEVTVAAGNVAGAGEASERVTFRTGWLLAHRLAQCFSTWALRPSCWP